MFNQKNPRFYYPDIKLSGKEKKVFDATWKVLFEGYDPKLFQYEIFDRLWFMSKSYLMNCYKSNMDFSQKIEYSREWSERFINMVQKFDIGVAKINEKDYFNNFNIDFAQTLSKYNENIKEL